MGPIGFFNYIKSIYTVRELSAFIKMFLKQISSKFIKVIIYICLLQKLKLKYSKICTIHIFMCDLKYFD